MQPMLLPSGQYPAWCVPPGLSADTQLSAGDPEAVLCPNHPFPGVSLCHTPVHVSALLYGGELLKTGTQTRAGQG